MELKHTPGSWSIAPRKANYKCNPSDQIERALLERHGLIDFEALSVGTSVGSVAIIPLDESNEANAMLIAAAPNLLAALIEAVDCGMVPISSASDGGAASHSRQVKAADMIRAAIAKATGAKQ